MCERFCPVLPGMARRVFAYESCTFVVSINAGMISFDRLLIVYGFVAEDQAERLLEDGTIDQQLPVTLSNLVTKMAQQGPVRFAKLRAPRFALRIVGFRQAQRDQPVQMTGHDGLAGVVGEDVERNVPIGLLAAERQLKPCQVIEKASFG